jgi:hypothetical protein
MTARIRSGCSDDAMSSDDTTEARKAAWVAQVNACEERINRTFEDTRGGCLGVLWGIMMDAEAPSRLDVMMFLLRGMIDLIDEMPPKVKATHGELLLEALVHAVRGGGNRRGR